MVKKIKHILKGGGTSGFTMIELLIVIAIIAILAVAVLSVLNPLEQIRKGRDTEREATSASLIGALERYNAAQGCYPWDDTPCPLAAMGTPNAYPVVAGSFATGTNLGYLVDADELKSNVASKASIAGGDLFLTENADGNMVVCFEPESTAGREGGTFGVAEGDPDGSNITASTCDTASYLGDGSGSCWVCLR